MTTPLVSICSITYNHAPFIRQCLDGFLMQQCNFPIEIIINDDCSTDGTTEIIREYAEKYPDKISPIFHEENLYSQGVRGMFQKFVFPKARGKYIAICEGDDYWIDPLKLQKQVDFLESHPDYSMCFHKAKVIAEGCREYVDYFSKLEEREYKAEKILTRWIIPTASILYRAQIQIPTHEDFRNGDVIVHAACAASGRVYCMAEEMSVYRLHGGGWSKDGLEEPLPLRQLVPHYLALTRVFSGHVSLIYKRLAAFYCSQWIFQFFKYRKLISIKYFLLASYYCNYIFLFYLVMIPLNKCLRKIGVSEKIIDPT